MPTYREEDIKELSLEDKRAACLHCWGRDFGNCDKCALKGINRRTYEELESQLSAEREARQRAEEEALNWRNSYGNARTASLHWRERAEAAEQRIKTSEDQEPAFVIHDELGNTHNLYKQPPIPPILAEVVRERDELRRKLAEQQSQNNFDAARLRRLVSFCGVAAPDSDEELLQVAGVVIGSCLRVLQNSAVPQPHKD